MGEIILRVWWVPRIPMKAFYVFVDSIKTAKKILTVLGDYDIFQYKNNVKGDYANAGGLQFLDEDGRWSEWEDENGLSIDDTDIV